MAGDGVYSVHVLGGFDRAQPDGKPIECEFYVLRDPVLGGPEGLFEPEQISVESETGFNVVRVEVDEPSTDWFTGADQLARSEGGPAKRSVNEESGG